MNKANLDYGNQVLYDLMHTDNGESVALSVVIEYLKVLKSEGMTILLHNTTAEIYDPKTNSRVTEIRKSKKEAIIVAAFRHMEKRYDESNNN